MKTLFFMSILLVFTTGLCLADGGVQPKELLDPTSAAPLEQIRANGECDAQLETTIENGALVATIKAGEAPWPGFVIVPAGNAPFWDLSLYGHVEVKVTNLGEKQELINLRVDNVSTPENRNPWNAEMVRIDPGKTQLLRVFFGYSYFFQKAYPLDPARVVRVLFFTGKLDHEVKLRFETLQAAGWSGEKPNENPDESRLKPKNGWVFGPEGPTVQEGLSVKASQAATVSATETDVKMRFPAGDANAEVTVKPPRGFWDFSEHMQVRLVVRNDGSAAVSPRFHLTSIDGTSTEVAPALPPGEAMEVVLPFAPAKPWTAPTNPAQELVTQGGGWDRLPSTGTSYRSHKTRGLVVLSDPSGAEMSLSLLSMRAENPPAIRPEWLGKRPPVAGDWKPTLQQEFDGEKLDDRLFNVYWFNWWDKRQHDSKDNVFLRDGKLVLRTEKKRGWHNDNPNPDDAMPGSLTATNQGRSLETDYATGWVDTYGKWTQRYGYFEVRCKLPTQPNLWPAVWFCPDSGLERYPRGLPRLDWNQFKWRSSTFGGGMEIDMVEAQSSWGPHRFNTACHWDGYGREHKKLGTSANYIPTDPDGFITVGMLWLPGSLSFYGNGELFWTWSSPRIIDEPIFFEIQNQLGGWDNDPLDPSLLPADFEIDYIRVWQRADLASADDGQKPNDGGLDGRVGPGLPGPAKPDPRNERLQQKLKELEDYLKNHP